MKGIIALLFFVLTAFWAGSSSAAAQEASSRLEADTLAVGDRFTYTLMLRDWEEFDEVIPPDSVQFGQNFEILELSETEGEMIKTLSYRLQYFGAGNTYIPDTQIGLRSGRDTLFISAPGRSFVFEGMVEDEEEAFRPLKPLFEFTAAALWIWLGMLAFVVIAGVLGYLYLKEKNKPASEPEPELPEPEPQWESPLDRLNAKLWRIRHEYQPPLDYYGQVFQELSMALRWYLKEVHEIPAPESTYGEIQQHLDRRMMSDEMQAPLLRVLDLCDRVKFAGFRPQQQNIDEALHDAGTFSGLAAEYDRGLMHLMRLFEEMEEEAQTEDQSHTEQTGEVTA